MAWFYWDPPREAFTIPLINRPVVWYGILFVTGFVLGYFLLNPLFSRRLTERRQLSPLEVLDWPTLIEELRNSSSPVVPQLMEQFDPSLAASLKQPQPPRVTPEMQRGLLEGFNKLLRSSSLLRRTLQQVFPHSLASPKQTAYLLTDRLCRFAVIGTILGARLGDVFFYDWPYFQQHPVEIFKVWEGGLASHGAVLGNLLAVYLYLKYIQRWIPELTFLQLLDDIVIPSAFIASLIRLGNFMNQEIVGIPTSLPWGVLFGHPANEGIAVPRHPVQLYEAAAYFITFLLLWQLWKNRYWDCSPGSLAGLMFICIFGSRLILEYWKATVESVIDSSFLQMGQILSLPCILLGILLIWRPCARTGSLYR